MRRAQLEALMADHLVDGEPALALNAIVLTRKDHATLRAATGNLAAAFETAARALQRDVSAMIDLGFPWVAAELLAAERARTPLLGRFDFVRDQDGGWRALEYNADTPSGLREGTALEPLVQQLAPGADTLCLPNAQLQDRVAAAFATAVGPGGRLGVVTAAGELEDLAQSEATARVARGRGVEVVVGDRDDLRATMRGLSLRRRPIDALYRLLSFESTIGTPLFAAIFEAARAGRVRLLNGLFGLLLQNKGVMAWLWRHRDDPALPPPQRESIARHLPPTWSIEDESATGDVVVKQHFGREGEEVFFGRDLTAAEWNELRRRRTYVLQRRIEQAALGAAVPTALGQRRWLGSPTVGCFTVDGAWAGYYTRFEAGKVTRRAKWLATLVE